MSKQPTSPKTVLEVQPEIHARVKTGASQEGTSVKRFSDLILDYALSKYECGDIVLTQPEVIEPATK